MPTSAGKSSLLQASAMASMFEPRPLIRIPTPPFGLLHISSRPAGSEDSRAAGPAPPAGADPPLRGKVRALVRAAAPVGGCVAPRDPPPPPQVRQGEDSGRVPGRGRRPRRGVPVEEVHPPY